MKSAHSLLRASLTGALLLCALPIAAQEPEAPAAALPEATTPAGEKTEATAPAPKAEPAQELQLAPPQPAKSAPASSDSSDILPGLPKLDTDQPPLPPLNTDLPPAEGTDPDMPSFGIRKRSPNSLVPDGPNPTEESAEHMKTRIRFRQVKLLALQNPEVKAALEAAKTARSDRELRAQLRLHYTLLFKQMRSLDASITPLIEEREAAALSEIKDTLRSSQSSQH